MQKLLCGLAGLATAFAFAGSPALAQAPIKIGIINAYSGQFADTGIQLDSGIKLYVEQHGDTVAGKKLEFIRKDVGGVAPDLAKRLAQELIVRDHADIFAGFALTPNALAVADISAEAKKFMVVMNAATSIITTKSPYIARRSSTRRSALGRPRRASRPPTRWCPTMAPASMPKAPSIPASRKPAVRSSA